MQTKVTLRLSVLSSILLVVVAPAIGADIIGPGDTATIFNDEGPNLMAVDLTHPVNLASGSYSVSAFNYQFTNNQSPAGGTIQPFLAVGSAPTFTAIAVGSIVAFGGTTAFTSAPFGGSDTFTLAAAQNVYAGVFWGTTPGQEGIQRMPVGYFPSGSTFLRFSSANAPTVGNPLSGGAGVGSFARTYDFSVTVNGVPEPSSLVLGGLGGLAMVLRRRRRGRE